MRNVALVVLVGLLAGLFLGEVSADDSPAQPKEVGAAYFAALEASDLDAAGKLFARKSSVFETGGVEGDWQHYRDHHLGPEVDAIASFSIDQQEPEVTTSADSTLAVITWPIDYTISLKDDRMIRSRGTVTFVMVSEEGAYRIRHLHWSSRKKRP